MTEEARVSSDESMPTSASSSASETSKPRKKRKWDQPAEAIASVGIAPPVILPFGNMGSFVAPSLSVSGAGPVPGAVLMNPLAASSAAVAQVLQVPSIKQQATGAVQKLIQPKIQDELIAREIIINDAESSVRYKLTKRQMQEEIQKCTGAVVITRGKYRPLNIPPDGEKPLYLHISAGAHLKETAERIKAVDHAAAMVEEMLKQGGSSLQVPSAFLSTLNNGLKAAQALSTCVFLGFDADPALNIAARIRGPNDQYINHIMNETGATVLLRGQASGNPKSSHGDEEQQPLHLLLTSNNAKSVEDARLLAENLLDTISVECGASRVASSKVYTAVPPPQKLLTGSLSVASIVPPVSVVPAAGTSNCGQPQANMFCYSQPSLTSGTSYNGYGGIYPQATPLQQVALALRQSNTPLNSTASPTTTAANMMAKPIVSSSPDKGKRPAQKRKFQELPAASKGPAKSDQGFEILKPNNSTAELAVRNISTMPAPKKLVQSSSDGVMPPPPPRTMASSSPSRTVPPPPPPPKFTPSKPLLKVNEKNNILKKSESNNVPDTLIKLMEYGDEDDDPEEDLEESPKSNPDVVMAPKPFWAV